MANPPKTRVDVHVHLTRYWRDLAGTAYRPDLAYTPKGLLAELDRAGVGTALAIAIQHAPNVAATLEEGRSLLAESGGRLRLVSTVDPTSGEEKIAEALALWAKSPELTAIKLFPGYLPFYPHDRRLDPVYEFAEQHRLPVMIHQGDTLERNGLLKFARPIEVDEVAVRWPRVQFVLCHLGNPWVDETAELVYKNLNVWTDCSGLLPNPTVRYFRETFEQARSLLTSVVATVGDADRVLYGSDWPLESIAMAVNLVETLPIPEEEREKILGGNARRLFRLD
ncbi:MAG: amidohydrolase family protein [Thermoplasmata archaeon]|nr:amidohydrolase family protein [Thermoplasmata archaeon]MCI4356138.1 amidohydrolase family protein [Thermoplasmata archaeon]